MQIKPARSPGQPVLLTPGFWLLTPAFCLLPSAFCPPECYHCFIFRQEERVLRCSREEPHPRVGLTKVGLKTQQDFGMGNPGVATRFGGEENAAGVILNAGEKEKE